MDSIENAVPRRRGDQGELGIPRKGIGGIKSARRKAMRTGAWTGPSLRAFARALLNGEAVIKAGHANAHKGPVSKRRDKAPKAAKK